MSTPAHDSTVEVCCPGCGKPGDLPVAIVGRTIRCDGCGQKFRAVPAAPSPSPPAPLPATAFPGAAISVPTGAAAAAEQLFHGITDLPTGAIAGPVPGLAGIEPGGVAPSPSPHFTAGQPASGGTTPSPASVGRTLRDLIAERVPDAATAARLMLRVIRATGQAGPMLRPDAIGTTTIRLTDDGGMLLPVGAGTGLPTDRAPDARAMMAGLGRVFGEVLVGRPLAGSVAERRDQLAGRPAAALRMVERCLGGAPGGGHGGAAPYASLPEFEADLRAWLDVLDPPSGKTPLGIAGATTASAPVVTAGSPAPEAATAVPPVAAAPWTAMPIAVPTIPPIATGWQQPSAPPSAFSVPAVSLSGAPATLTTPTKPTTSGPAGLPAAGVPDGAAPQPADMPSEGIGLPAMPVIAAAAAAVVLVVVGLLMFRSGEGGYSTEDPNPPAKDTPRATTTGPGTTNGGIAPVPALPDVGPLPPADGAARGPTPLQRQWRTLRTRIDLLPPGAADSDAALPVLADLDRFRTRVGQLATAPALPSEETPASFAEVAGEVEAEWLERDAGWRLMRPGLRLPAGRRTWNDIDHPAGPDGRFALFDGRIRSGDIDGATEEWIVLPPGHLLADPQPEGAVRTLWRFPGAPVRDWVLSLEVRLVDADTRASVIFRHAGSGQAGLRLELTRSGVTGLTGDAPWTPLPSKPATATPKSASPAGSVPVPLPGAAPAGKVPPIDNVAPVDKTVPAPAPVMTAKAAPDPASLLPKRPADARRRLHLISRGPEHVVVLDGVVVHRATLGGIEPGTAGLLVEGGRLRIIRAGMVVLDREPPAEPGVPLRMPAAPLSRPQPSSASSRPVTPAPR